MPQHYSIIAPVAVLSRYSYTSCKTLEPHLGILAGAWYFCLYHNLRNADLTCTRHECSGTLYLYGIDIGVILHIVSCYSTDRSMTTKPFSCYFWYSLGYLVAKCT